MWYTLLFKKELWLIIGALILIAGSWIAIQKWHYNPIEKKDLKIISLENQLKIVGNVLNICEANLTKQNIQGFIEAVGENNDDQDIVIGFDNLST